MARRQWLWYLFQIAVVMGVVWLVTVTGERPDLVQFSVILGVVAAAIITAITMRLWPGRGAAEQVDHVPSDAFRALRPPGYSRDRPKLIDGSRAGEDRR